MGFSPTWTGTSPGFSGSGRACGGRQGKAEVVCFPQQVPFVEDFLGGLADLRVVELDAVEEGVKEP